MTRRRLAARALTLVCPVVSLLAVPHAAHAAPPSPVADVWIRSWSGAFAEVCAQGDVNDGATAAARWVFTVAGAVANGTLITPFVRVENGDTYALYCHTFYAGSPPDAAFTAAISFAGAGVNSDVAGGAVLIYDWTAVFGDDDQISFGTGG